MCCVRLLRVTSRFRMLGEVVDRMMASTVIGALWAQSGFGPSTNEDADSDARLKPFGF